MNQPVRLDDASGTVAAQAPIAVSTPATAFEDEVPSLPAGHPTWQRDALSVSSRARAILETLRPLAVRVLTFWDHAMRSVRIGARSVEVDPSGCYRLR